MTILITIIITYYLLIISYNYKNNDKKSQSLLSRKGYGVMFIKFIAID